MKRNIIQLLFYIISLASCQSQQLNATGQDDDVLHKDIRQEKDNSPIYYKPNQDAKDDFYVIAAMFNPACYQKRYDLYHAFANHMNHTGAQLVTIEAIFPAIGQHEFKVTEENNSRHIQVRSESVYWLKESLINIAVSKLPRNAKYVAWIDADIEFTQNDWVQRTKDALKDNIIVQVFETANFLGPDNEILRTDHSFGYSAINGNKEWYAHPGYGWATTLEAYQKMGGLPEFDIMGSNDLHFAYSLVNSVSGAARHWLHPTIENYIVQQSQIIYDKLREMEIAGINSGKNIVGYVPEMRINHIWHGSWKDRQYVRRWEILNRNLFNFTSDMVRGQDGLLTFDNSTKARQIQKDILGYFKNRNEDNKLILEDGKPVGESNSTNKSANDINPSWFICSSKYDEDDNDQGATSPKYAKHEGQVTYTYTPGYGYTYSYTSPFYHYTYRYSNTSPNSFPPTRSNNTSTIPLSQNDDKNSTFVPLFFNQTLSSSKSHLTQTSTPNDILTGIRNTQSSLWEAPLTQIDIVANQTLPQSSDPIISNRKPRKTIRKRSILSMLGPNTVKDERE